MQVITAPTEEPISLSQAKAHLRLDGSDEDDLVNSLIRMARDLAERHLRRALCTQTMRLYLDQFPAASPTVQVNVRTSAISLPRAPVQSISHVKYIDADGVLQTIDPSDYQLDEISEPCVVVPAYGESWPAPRQVINAVQVQFVAGYGGASAVPEPIRRGMLLTIANLFENRQDVITGTIAAALPMSASTLLAPYRLWRFI